MQEAQGIVDVKEDIPNLQDRAWGSSDCCASDIWAFLLLASGIVDDVDVSTGGSIVWSRVMSSLSKGGLCSQIEAVFVLISLIEYVWGEAGK